MSRRSRDGGFTLVEVLVALSIFAIGLLAIAGMSVTSIKGNYTGGSLTAATTLAEGILEEILSRDPNDPLFTSTPLATDAIWDIDLSDFKDLGNFSVTYTIAPHPNVNMVTTVTVIVRGPRTVRVTGYKGLV
jgi:type IV pilus assembly protein PilV